MADQLKPVTVVAPGFFGLNTQDSSVTLPKEYALKAENAVIDQFGRIASRRGWVKVNTSSGFNSTEPALIKEVIKTDGSKEILSIGDNKIYSGTTTLTLKYTGTTWTAQNWKAVDFNGFTYFFQRNHNPLIYVHSTNTYSLMSAYGSYSGTVPLANEVLSAFGRLWVADTSTDKRTVTWSDSLQGFAWTGGTAGSVNIEKVLTNGTDTITALAAFNGYLIIFCRRSIIIYNGAQNDPTTNLSLVEVIDGVGCISRDTVQDVGTDIFFLSDSGVKSLARVIQEKSNPIFDISRNVKNDLITDIATNGNDDNIKSVYSDADGFYLLSLPSRKLIYCFDVKSRLQDGSCKVTTWTIAPISFCATSDRKLYFSRTGYIAQYSGASDNGTAYTFSYYTSNIDAQTPGIFKILKKMTMLLIGGNNTTINIRWATDYSNSYKSGQYTLPTIARAEYNIAQYNIDEYNTGYNTGLSVRKIERQISGTGGVFQIGIEANIATETISVQQLDVFVKTGRVI
jgi:hypothetical protein